MKNQKNDCHECSRGSAFSRRQILAGSSALAGATLLGRSAQARPLAFVGGGGSGRDTLVLIFLRGAMDGLTTLVPHGDVDYYNAHGTSTRLNEPGEAKALRAVFGENMPPVSSTKSMTGHLLGAAGAIEAIASIMAIRDGIIPPNINFETPDPECIVNLVANTARQAKVAIVVSNSLGFGGHNAALVLRRYG